MTILASDIITPELLERLAQVPEEVAKMRTMLSFKGWVREHRTCTFGLARQTYKSHTLRKYTDESTLLIVPNEVIRRITIQESIDPSAMADRVFTASGFVHAVQRGQLRGIDRVIIRVFLDELINTRISTATAIDPVLDAIEELHIHHRLADNFFILSVGTPY